LPTRLGAPFALLLLAACSAETVYWGSTPLYVRNELAAADRLMAAGETELARERYDRMAETGHPEALIDAGQAWLDAPDADPARARELFEAAWSRNSQRRDQAGLWLARSLADDDPERAIGLLETVAERGQRGAAGSLAKLLAEHHPDDPRIEPLLRQAAAEGDLTSQLTLGRRYEDNEALYRAIVELEARSASGDASAANRLARVYSAKGPLPDSEQYLAWLRLAAERGDSNAMLNYGRVLLEGEIVAYDPEQGIEWLRRAAQADDHWAQLELGRRLVRGDDIDPDPERARMWLERAAAQGNEKAASTLADL
jgi:TPR repeat protein